MKRKGLVLAAAVLLAGGIWWWIGPRYALDGPPRLTVSAGDGKAEVGYWSADWASPTTNFNACGDAPTDPAARSNQPVVYVRDGTENLTLSYPVAPSQVTVRYIPDSGEPGTTLYEGAGRRELIIPLPEDFRGIYEVSENWRTVPPAAGSAQRGFLVVGEGESVGDPKLAEPPELTVADGAENRVTARLGSYYWSVWLGEEEMEGTIADAPHPLEMDDLPAMSVQPGDLLELQFAVPPDRTSVWVWSVRKGILQQPVEVDIWSGDQVSVPELDGAAVFEVRGSWYLAGDTWGDGSYLFSVM